MRSPTHLTSAKRVRASFRSSSRHAFAELLAPSQSFEQAKSAKVCRAEIGSFLSPFYIHRDPDRNPSKPNLDKTNNDSSPRPNRRGIYHSNGRLECRN